MPGLMAFRPPKGPAHSWVDPGTTPRSPQPWRRSLGRWRYTNCADAAARCCGYATPATPGHRSRHLTLAQPNRRSTSHTRMAVPLASALDETTPPHSLMCKGRRKVFLRDNIDELSPFDAANTPTLRRRAEAADPRRVRIGSNA